jgi:hypothetical protein
MRYDINNPDRYYSLDTYSHLLPGMGGEAAGAMERIFS